MPPNNFNTTGVLFEGDVLAMDSEYTSGKDVGDYRVASKRDMQIVWTNVTLFTILHLSALYGLFLILTGSSMWQTNLMMFVGAYASGMSISAGAHRLWSHKSYKAKTPLKILLIILNSMAFQHSIIDWARDHRMHHKFSETDADPHNATRGLFFSHMGWLMVKKHPELMAKRHAIDMSDLYADPILVFQKKYYIILMPIFCFLLPTVMPMVFWGESLVNAYFVNAMLRYTFGIHLTFMVNSFAHKYGTKSYDQRISPTDNQIVCALVLGEGSHNYHHTFPWDYKTGELGGVMNWTKVVIDTFARIGWAYDLKTTPLDVIQKRVLRTGDGSHSFKGQGDKGEPKAEDNEELTKDG